MTGGDWTRIALTAVLAIIVVAICVLSVESRLAGEAATMLGAIVGFLTSQLTTTRPTLAPAPSSEGGER